MTVSGSITERISMAKHGKYLYHFSNSYIFRQDDPTAILPEKVKAYILKMYLRRHRCPGVCDVSSVLLDNLFLPAMVYTLVSHC